MIIGCALYTDVLKPASLLSLTLQDDNVDVAQGIKSILKFHTLKKLTTQDVMEWPVTKFVLSKLSHEDGGNVKVYQGFEMKNFSDAIIRACSDQALADLQSLDDHMRSRLEWSDVELLRSILLFLDTQSWQLQEAESDENSDDRLSEIKGALVKITEAPLEARGINITASLDEVEDIVEYARAYLRIGCDSYKIIWYQLKSSPDSSKWPNVFLITDLLFSLPFSTAKVERYFSILKVIKNERNKPELHYT